MNQEFKKCLEGKKIVAFPTGKKLAAKELSVARSDLSDAKAGFDTGRYKWSTIQAYYAMFHAARALFQGLPRKEPLLPGYSLESTICR